jgi:hypothetical protein
VTFPLEKFATAVAARAETWIRLELAWQTGPISPNYGKPVVRSEFESPSWLAEIMMWSTGETELSTIRLTDDRVVNKHYDLTSVDDLEAVLDDLTALVADDRVPASAIIVHGPTITP